MYQPEESKADLEKPTASKTYGRSVAKKDEAYMWDQAVLNTPKIPEDKLDEDNFDPSVTSPDHPYWSTDFSILETEPAESRLDSTQPDSTIMASTSRQEGSDMSGEKDTSQPIIKTIQNADPASTTIRHTAQIYSIIAPLFRNQDVLPVIDPNWITELEKPQQDPSVIESGFDTASLLTETNENEVPEPQAESSSVVDTAVAQQPKPKRKYTKKQKTQGSGENDVDPSGRKLSSKLTAVEILELQAAKNRLYSQRSRDKKKKEKEEQKRIARELQAQSGTNEEKIPEDPEIDEKRQRKREYDKIKIRLKREAIRKAKLEADKMSTEHTPHIDRRRRKIVDEETAAAIVERRRELHNNNMDKYREKSKKITAEPKELNQPASESRTTASSFTTGNDGINVIEEPTGSPSIGIDTDGASILSTQPLYPELTMILPPYQPGFNTASFSTGNTDNNIVSESATLGSMGVYTSVVQPSTAKRTKRKSTKKIQKVHQTRIVSDEPPRQSAQDVPSATDTIFRVNQAEPARIYRTQINPPADVLPFGPVVIKILYPMTANQAVRVFTDQVPRQTQIESTSTAFNQPDLTTDILTNDLTDIRYPDPASTTTGDPAQISYSIKTPLYGNEDDLPVIDPSWITELEASQQDLPTREDETELGSHSTGKNTVEIPYSGISKMSGKKPKKVISEEERKRRRIVDNNRLKRWRLAHQNKPDDQIKKERAQNRLSSRRYRQRLRNEIEERKRELQMKRTVAILSKSSNERPESQSNNLQLYDNETGDFEDQSTVPDDDSGSQNED